MECVLRTETCNSRVDPSSHKTPIPLKTPMPPSYPKMTIPQFTFSKDANAFRAILCSQHINYVAGSTRCHERPHVELISISCVP